MTYVLPVPNLFESPQDLLAMPTQKVAAVLCTHLHGLHGVLGEVSIAFATRDYPLELRAPAATALLAAWKWLLSDGSIEQRRQDNPGVRLTLRGRLSPDPPCLDRWRRAVDVQMPFQR